jgi:hypothetical protein
VQLVRYDVNRDLGNSTFTERKVGLVHVMQNAEMSECGSMAEMTFYSYKSGGQ